MSRARPPSSWRRPAALAGLALLCAGLALPAAAAQDGGADLLHTVVPGDTLYDIARAHLADPARWPELQRGNGVADPRRLRPGSRLRIPAALRRGEPVPAEVAHVSGAVRAQSPAGPLPVESGSPWPPGTRIEVDEGGFVSLRLADGSIVRVLAGSQVELRQLLQQPGGGATQSVIGVQRGRVEADVQPQPPGRGRFEIHTPHVVAGVRGTRFGVGVGREGLSSGGVTAGTVEFRGQPGAPGARTGVLVQAGQGVAADAGGRLGPVGPLLPAPDLSALQLRLAGGDAVVLSWPAVAQAGGYLARLAPAHDAERVRANAESPEPGVRFAGIEDGDYQLSVRSVGPGGVPGLEAVAPVRVKANPVPPLVQAPAPGGQVDGPDVALSCTEVVGATHYLAELTGADGAPLPLAQPGARTACRFEAEGLAPGHYRWRVAAATLGPRGLPDPGPYGDEHAFEVLPPPPAAPAFAVPAAVVSGRLAVHWREEPGLRQRVQLAHEPGFGTPLRDETLSAGGLSLEGLPAGTYYLRLQSVDTATGRAGAFSAPRRVHVGPLLQAAEGVPVLAGDGLPVRLH